MSSCYGKGDTAGDNSVEVDIFWDDGTGLEVITFIYLLPHVSSGTVLGPGRERRLNAPAGSPARYTYRKINLIERTPVNKEYIKIITCELRL